MYAVVRTGGKQLRVSPGDVVKVEKLPMEPVPNAKVICMSLGDGKEKKIIVYKYKRRKGYARKQGHRQIFTRLSVKEILVG
jgi:large subunit ribosomal protein L21